MLIKKYKNQSPLDVVLSTTDINDLFSLMVNNGKTLEELSNSNTLEAPNDQIRSISTGINVIVPVIGTYPETGYFVAKSTYLPKYTPNKTKPKQNIIDFTLTSTGDINKLYEIMILNDASINLNVFDTTLDYIVPNFEYNDSVKFINNDSVIINTGALSKQELNPLLDYNGDFNQDFNAGLPVPEPVGYSATFTFFDEGDVWGGLINTTEGTFDVIQGTTIQTFTNGYHTITIDPFQPVNINGSIYGFATTNIIKDITIRHNSFATITIENAEGYLILDSEYAANIFANNNNFTQENIDTLLIQMDNIVLLGTATIDLRSTNNIAPSETGLLAKDNLIAKGWIVLTSGALPQSDDIISFNVASTDNLSIGYETFDSSPVTITGGTETYTLENGAFALSIPFLQAYDFFTITGSLLSITIGDATDITVDSDNIETLDLPRAKGTLNINTLKPIVINATGSGDSNYQIDNIIFGAKVQYMNNLYLNFNNLSTDVINQLLIFADNNNITNPTYFELFQYPLNSVPTGLGLDAKNSLIAKGAYVYTN